MLSHSFVGHAFFAASFIAIASGLVGYFVVLRNEVFVADAQSHVAFAGAMAALVVGVDAAIGLFAATVTGAMVMGALGGRVRGRDVGIGVIFAWVLGLGVLFLSLYTTQRSAQGPSAGMSILFGSIYGLSAHRAEIAAGVAIACTLVTTLIARPLLFASIDPDVAAARGVPVTALGLMFMALVGVTVGEAVQALGALLSLALIATPALTAHLVTARPYRAMAISVALSVAAVWLGLTLSYAFPTLPPSFVVVAVAFGSYVVVVAGRAVRHSTMWQQRSASPSLPTEVTP